jgi:hypothetical protein
MRHATTIPLLLLALAACTVPDAVPEHRKVRVVADSGEEGYGEALSEERYDSFDDWWWDAYGVPAEIRFEVDRVTRRRGRAVVDYWIRVMDRAPPGEYRFRAKVTLSYLLQPEEDIEFRFVLRVPENCGGRWLMVSHEVPEETPVVPVEIDTGG